MLCQNCGKKEANVKYTQIINGVKKQMSLCEECSKDMGIENMNFNMPISFSNFFGDVLEEYNDFVPEFLQQKEEDICPSCKMQYNEFFKLGKFGCEDCYSTFENRMNPILKNIHGATKHIGRNGKLLGKPKEEVKQEIKPKQEIDKIEELKEKLKLEIKEERYEEAAKTRDEIKKIEERKE